MRGKRRGRSGGVKIACQFKHEFKALLPLLTALAPEGSSRSHAGAPLRGRRPGAAEARRRTSLSMARHLRSRHRLFDRLRRRYWKKRSRCLTKSRTLERIRRRQAAVAEARSSARAIGASTSGRRSSRRAWRSIAEEEDRLRLRPTATTTTTRSSPSPPLQRTKTTPAASSSSCWPMPSASARGERPGCGSWRVRGNAAR